MIYITEMELRQQFEHGVPANYTPPEGTRLTPAAQDYLREVQLGGDSYYGVPVHRVTTRPENRSDSMSGSR